MSGSSSGLKDTGRSRSPSRQRSPEWRHDSLVCKPLDTLNDITEFLKNPPPWRSLCIELQPHSEDAIRNMDIVLQNHPEPDHEVQVENPETFCHFDAEEDVRRHRRKDLPKTLVCHDMANGYHDDCVIDGTGNFDAYTFYNWAVVDIFCYFSHHFITIPPLAWINVGHAHGVKVIGTVITEWGAGESIWDSLLADPEEWKAFARHLVAIAKILKFDGWLLNVENPISKPAELVRFVRHLHALLHRELPTPALLWYDSVTVDGSLAWQNRLNEKNRAFFDACDGIFTNYSWGEEDLRASRAAAGARAAAVFVGLDVWGRNFLGGGRFNTQQAIKVPHSLGLSVAIFAPAWTHEAMESGESLVMSRLRWFLLRDRALWGSLWPFLNTKLPSALPFSTSFCLGQGRKRWLYGEVICPVPWYNLRHQQYHPSAVLGPHGYRLAAETQQNGQLLPMANEHETTTDVIESSENTLDSSQVKDVKPKPKRAPQKTYQLVLTDEAGCREIYLEDGFIGGGCLKITPFDPEKDKRLVKLFHCDFAIEEAFVACVVTKTLPGYEDQWLNVVVCVRDGEGVEARVVLGRGAGGGVRPVTGQVFKDLQRYLLLHQQGFYVSVENSYGWKVRYYLVAARRSVVRWAGCGGGARGPALLGHFALCRKFETKD